MAIVWRKASQQKCACQASQTASHASRPEPRPAFCQQRCAHTPREIGTCFISSTRIHATSGRRCNCSRGLLTLCVALVLVCCCVQLKKLHKLDLSQLTFVGESLTALRKEVGNTAAVLGEWRGPHTTRVSFMHCSACSFACSLFTQGGAGLLPQAANKVVCTGGRSLYSRSLC